MLSFAYDLLLSLAYDLLDTAWRIAQFLIVVALLYLAFTDIAELSSHQSMVLAVVLGCAWLVYDMATRRFVPHCVGVTPQWPELLLDYKLIKDDEELRQLEERQVKLGHPWEWKDDEKEELSGLKYWGWNVLPDGILFTVLQRHPYFDLPALIYWNDHKTFTHKLDFSERIEGIQIESDHVTGLTRSPALYFRDGPHRYELGLEVPTHWWERICATGELKDLAKTKSDTDYLTETTRLRIAILPYAELGHYYHKRRKWLGKLRDMRMARYGWKREVRDLPYDPDPWDRVEHKYFTVAHRSI